MTSTNIIKALGGAELDTTELVTSLVSATKEPRQKLIDIEKKKVDVAISTTALLNSALTTLQSAATEVGSLTKLNKLSVTSGDSSVVTAGPSNSGVAKAGTYAVEVIQLAQPQRTTSNALASTFSAAATTLTFSGGSGFTGGAVEIGAGDSPASVVSKINSSSVAKTNKIKASLVNTNKTPPYVIVIESQSGAANAFSIDDSAGNQFGFETLAKSTDNIAKNSRVKINNIEVERSSNTIADAITGLSLQLNSAKEGSTVQLSVAADASAIATNMRNFVEAYNLVSDLIKRATGPAAEGDDIAGTLKADTNARSIMLALRDKLTKESRSPSGAITHWGSIGVAFDRNGVLQFDESKMTDAFQAAPDDVVKALSNNAQSPYLSSGLNSGLAGDVAITAYRMLQSTGVVKAMTDGFEAGKLRVEARQTDLDKYIERLQDRYEKQFSALNAVLSEFKATQERLKSAFNQNSNN